MKRVVSFVVALLICCSMVCVASAEEFAPSVPSKDAPSIVPVTDPNGKARIGVIRNTTTGEIVDYVDEDCLLVTPVSQATTSQLIPAAARDLLLKVYNELKSGLMQIPYEKFNAGLKAADMVIRDLFDATWLCIDQTKVDCADLIEPEGVVLDITFNLGVSKDAKVYVMAFKNNEWNPIVKTVNNGDGTVTCTFEHLCPIAFSVSSADMKPPVQTGDPANLVFWFSLMAVSAVALVVLVWAYRRKTAR